MDRQQVLQIIGKQLDRIGQFGQLQITVKNHLGELSNIDFVHLTSERIRTPEPNVTAATKVYEMLKGASISAAQMRKPTTITFSIDLNRDGEADRISVQDFQKV